VEIEPLVRAERWREARAAIRSALQEKPNSHWLLTRLSLTYYEERKYAMALRYVEAAAKVAPRCPLVLWDLAGTLQMVGQHEAAIRIFKRLAARSVTDIAEGPCGEGRAWARGLVADVHYRLSQCYRAQGRMRAADNALVRHLNLRGPGCWSIYPLEEVKASHRNVRPSGKPRRGPTRA